MHNSHLRTDFSCAPTYTSHVCCTKEIHVDVQLSFIIIILLCLYKLSSNLRVGSGLTSTTLSIHFYLFYFFVDLYAEYKYKDKKRRACYLLVTICPARQQVCTKKKKAPIISLKKQLNSEMVVLSVT